MPLHSLFCREGKEEGRGMASLGTLRMLNEMGSCPPKLPIALLLLPPQGKQHRKLRTLGDFRGAHITGAGGHDDKEN